MSTLYIFAPGFGRPSLSPFCEKSVTWLALSGIEHDVKIGDPRRSPTGKLPVWRDDTGVVSDSSRIQRHLVHRHGEPFDGHLRPEQHAVGHVVRRTCEEHLYWFSVWLKWVHPPGAEAMKPLVRELLPPVIAPLLMPLVFRKPARQLKGHGLGLQSDSEIERRAIADLDALETLVGSGPFLFGPQVSSFDITLHAFVSGITAVPVDHPAVRHARSLPALSHLCEAIDDKVAAARGTAPEPDAEPDSEPDSTDEA